MPPNSLPQEIWIEITRHLDVDGWRNVRLVSRSLATATTRHLFDSVTLKPTEGSIERFGKVSKSSRLGEYAKRIVIETFSSIAFISDDRGWRFTDFSEDRDFPAAFLPAFNDGLNKDFCNAAALELKFSIDVAKSSYTVMDYLAEWKIPRSGVLETLFRSLAARSKETTLRTIDSLTIVNLSDFVHNKLTSSNPFLETMQSLKELHLCIFIGGCALLPKIEIHTFAFRDFMPHLRFGWLEPIAGQLTALSLYFNDYWGAIPYLDVTDLRFPKLRSLALGKYTFAHQTQISWLTSLTSLETLILDNSPLTVVLGLDRTDISWFNIDTSQWRSISLRDHQNITCVCDNFARWSGYFDKIRSKLYNLKSFQFCHGRWEGIVSCFQRPATLIFVAFVRL